MRGCCDVTGACCVPLPCLFRGADGLGRVRDGTQVSVFSPKSGSHYLNIVPSCVSRVFPATTPLPREAASILLDAVLQPPPSA